MMEDLQGVGKHQTRNIDSQYIEVYCIVPLFIGELLCSNRSQS